MSDLREAARRALQSLNDLIADSSDPGVEALGAQYELQLALVGGTAVHVDLRDRIRHAVCEAEGFAWDDDGLEPDEYGEVADAVLAVLPARVGRAALLQVADRFDGMPEADAPALRAGVTWATSELRRLADEAQQPEEAWPPSVSWRVETVWHDGTWRKYGPSWDIDHAWMKEHFARDSADTGRAFRLVRATATYTVEAEGAQR